MSKFLAYMKFAPVLLAGVLIGYFLCGYRQNTPVTKENREVLTALSKASALRIPQEAVHCEVAGPGKNINGSTVYPATRVSDFIAAYLSWSQQRARDGATGLECEGNSLKHCIWRFGEAKTFEGWSTILRFDYDPSAQAIVPQSLSCTTVP